MYKNYSIKDTFEMSPENFGKEIKTVAEKTLQDRYEGTFDRDVGIILIIFDVRDISDGVIYPGDPSVHYNVEFDILTYMPKIEEIVVGEVTELMDFGAFVRIGPIDGLVHVSQITDDFVSLDKKTLTFQSKKGGRTLRKGDIVYAKVSTVSMKNRNLKDSRIALTMRPEGLGKPEWMVVPVKKAVNTKDTKNKSRKR